MNRLDRPREKRLADHVLREWAQGIQPRLAHAYVGWAVQENLTPQGPMPEVAIVAGWGNHVRASGTSWPEAANKAIRRMEGTLAEWDFKG